MLESTSRAIRAICATDTTIKPDELRRALDALAGRGGAPAAGVIPRVISRSEAARILGVNARTVDLWARRGCLERVVPPCSTKSVGFTEDSIRALAMGVKKAGVA